MVRNYRYFDLVMVAFVAVYLCSWRPWMLPLTVRIVNTLKKAEAEDYYDRNTNFTPFSLKT